MAKASKAAASSALQQGFAAFERGDLVMARRAYARVIAGPATPADEEAAKGLAAQLGLTASEPSDARAVATELNRRTNIRPKAYIFVGVAALLDLLMLTLAAFRSA